MNRIYLAILCVSLTTAACDNGSGINQGESVQEGQAALNAVPHLYLQDPTQVDVMQGASTGNVLSRFINPSIKLGGGIYAEGLNYGIKAKARDCCVSASFLAAGGYMGLYVPNNGTTYYGVRASGNGYGVYGEGSTPGSYGVYGLARGLASGVYGYNDEADPSAAGPGVTGTSANGVGVYGVGKTYGFDTPNGSHVGDDLAVDNNRWGDGSGWIACSEDVECACPEGQFQTKMKYSKGPAGGVVSMQVYCNKL